MNLETVCCLFVVLPKGWWNCGALTVSCSVKKWKGMELLKLLFALPQKLWPIFMRWQENICTHNAVVPSDTLRLRSEIWTDVCDLSTRHLLKNEPHLDDRNCPDDNFKHSTYERDGVISELLETSIPYGNVILGQFIQ